MSKRINVNPDHYKVAGRERQGEEVVASEEKQKFVKVQHDLAARAEQRTRSLEAMKGRTTQAAREAGGGSAAQTHARKKAAKAPSGSGDEPEGGAESRRGIAVPAGVRRIAAAAATKAASVAEVRPAKIAARKAKNAVKKTKRAAVKAGAGAAAVVRRAAAKTKKAVTPRPKQALPKKKAAVRAGATSRPARKK
jgi:hypothetical protein